MKIGRPFNTFTFQEYFPCIDNHKKYTDFNTLGLYRSIIENSKLTVAQQIAVRDHAHKYFHKTFNFFQLKDPGLYVKLTLLGQDWTWQQEGALWDEVRRNQQKILADKKFGHRNFGVYSKHDCGHEHCPYNGLMLNKKISSWYYQCTMNFPSDKNEYSTKLKAQRYRKARKHAHRLINQDQDLD